MEAKQQSQQYMDMGGGVDGPTGVHPSILPTEPKDGPAGYGGSADRLVDGENSLFDKGLIETA
jgi:hypothetical protein